MIQSLRRNAPTIIICVPLSLLLVAIAYNSLDWKMGYDTAWMLYIARMMDAHGKLPYRDMFDNNIIGAFFTYIAIGRLIGYTGDLALRIFDLVYLALICGVNILWMRRINAAAAWCGSILFGLVYLGSGPNVLTQREYLLLLPILIAVYLATEHPRLDNYLRAFLIGLMFGIASSVKPNAGIGLPAVMGYLYFELKARGSLPEGKIWTPLLLTGLTGIGFAIPWTILIGYLLYARIWDDFIAIAVNYWPLHATISKALVVTQGSERTRLYIENLVALNGMWPWLVPASLGIGMLTWHRHTDNARQRLLWLMVAMTLAYALYPAITGNFFAYHWLPFAFWIINTAALALAVVNDRQWFVRIVPALTLAGVVFLKPDVVQWHIQHLYNRYALGQPEPSIDGGRSNEIAAYLNNRLRPGDTVQLLDATGVTLRALLDLDVPLATSFLTDTTLYAYISDPYMSGLRMKFLRELEINQPEFVIEYTGRTYISGPDTRQNFPELEAFLASRYTVVYIGHDFSIYEWSKGVTSGLVIYPLRKNQLPIHSYVPPPDNVIAFPGTNPLTTEQIDTPLKNLMDTNQFLHLEYMDGGTDLGQVLETWAADNAFRIQEFYIRDTRVVEYLSDRAECSNTRTMDAQFGNLIALNQTSVGDLTVGEDRFVCVVLSWQANQAIAESYRVVVQLLNGEGIMVAQYDSVPKGFLAPTYTWKPGEAVIDRFAIRLPPGTPAGTYSVVIALYNENGFARLLVSAGEVESDQLIIGTLNLK